MHGAQEKSLEGLIKQVRKQIFFIKEMMPTLSLTSCSVTWSTVVSLCLGPVTDGSLSNTAYLITVMNFIITSTPSEKNEGH